MVPLLGGVAILLLFYRLARRYLTPTAGLIGLAILALGERLVYYVDTIKPYSSDAAFCLLLVSILIEAWQRRNTAWAWALGVAAGLIVWFSHPAVFVTAGVFTTLIALSFFSGDRRMLLAAIGASVIAGGSFVVEHQLLLKALDKDKFFHDAWLDGFMPRPGENGTTVAGTLLWCVKRFVEAFVLPMRAYSERIEIHGHRRPAVAFFVGSVAAASFFIGCVALFGAGPRPPARCF